VLGGAGLVLGGAWLVLGCAGLVLDGCTGGGSGSERKRPCSRLQGAAPLLSGGWRPEFIEQHRQGFTQLEPVAGGVGEQESALRNKASILDSSSASRLFSCRSCSVSFLSCSVSLLSCFIRSSCCILRCS